MEVSGHTFRRTEKYLPLYGLEPRTVQSVDQSLYYSSLKRPDNQRKGRRRLYLNNNQITYLLTSLLTMQTRH
jgi:hypothetical protein